MNKIKCKWCGYKWLPRIANPKKCPNCGTRKYREKKPKEQRHEANISSSI